MKSSGQEFLGRLEIFGKLPGWFKEVWSPGMPRIPSLEAPGDESGEELRTLEWWKERCGWVRMEAKWGEGLKTNIFSF